MRLFRLRTLSLLAVLVLCLTGCTKEEEETPLAFMRINDVEITQAEFTLYLYETIISFETIGGPDIWETDFDGRSAVDVAAESALNSMIAVKVITQDALSRNMELNENQLKEVPGDVAAQKKIYEDMKLVVSEEIENAIEDVIKDRMLYALAKKAIVDQYVFVEADFQAYHEAYYEETERQMQLIFIEAIACADEETAEMVYNMILNGGDFDTLFEEYSIIQDKSQTALSVYEKDVDMELAHVLGGQVDFVTKPIIYGDGTWRLLKITDIIESSEAEIDAKLRTDYDNIMQQQLFSQQLEALTNSARIETNNEALETFYEGFWTDYEKQRTDK